MPHVPLRRLDNANPQAKSEVESRFFKGKRKAKQEELTRRDDNQREDDAQDNEDDAPWHSSGKRRKIVCKLARACKRFLHVAIQHKIRSLQDYVFCLSSPPFSYSHQKKGKNRMDEIGNIPYLER